MRPIILNGISDVAVRGDLADRSVFLTLEPIPESGRKLDGELKAEFEAACPAILGALLDAMARGLKRLPTIKLDRRPRMADFAYWATACETEPGAFMAAYDRNRDEAADTVIESDVVATAVRDLMVDRETWNGTPGGLLEELNSRMPEAGRAKSWPGTARALTSALTRVAPALRRAGISVERGEREGKARRWISLRMKGTVRAENKGMQPSAPSFRPQAARNADEIGSSFVDGAVDDFDGWNGNRPTFHATVRDKSLKNNGADGVDGSDGSIPRFSAGTVCAHCGGSGKLETTPVDDRFVRLHLRCINPYLDDLSAASCRAVWQGAAQ